MKKLHIKVLFSLFSVLLIFGGISFLFAENLVIFRLLGTHLNLGMGKETNLSPSQPAFSSILSLQQELKNQTTSSLIDQLDAVRTEKERSLVLEKYLSSAQHLLSTSTNLTQQEDATIEEYSRKIKDCETPINKLNVDFTAAVQRYDFTASRALSQEIATLRSCIAENTVYYKEHLVYRDSTLSFQTTLQKRVDYLTTNKEKIITYYDILKPQLLKELYDISQTLEVNFGG